MKRTLPAVDESTNRIEVCQIEGARFDSLVRRTLSESPGYLLGLAKPPRGNRDGCPCGGQAARRLEANAARSSGDDHRLAGEVNALENIVGRRRESKSLS